MATASVTQATVRWYVDDNADPDSMTALASETDSSTEGNVTRGTGTANRLVGRVLMQNSSAALWNSACQWQYDRKPSGGSFSGSWTDINASSSYIRTTGGTPTADELCDTSLLTGGTGTFETDGTFNEDDGAPVTPSIAKNNHGEFAVCLYLVAGEVGVGDVLAVRLTGAAVTAWTKTLYVTVAATAQTMNGVAASASPAATTGAVSPGAVTMAGVAAAALIAATVGVLSFGSLTMSGSPAAASVAATAGGLWNHIRDPFNGTSPGAWWRDGFLNTGSISGGICSLGGSATGIHRLRKGVPGDGPPITEYPYFWRQLSWTNSANSDSFGIEIFDADNHNVVNCGLTNVAGQVRLSMSLINPTDGTTTYNSTAYDAAVHKWLRIRHDKTGSGTTYFETSTDGDSWTARYTCDHSVTQPNWAAHAGLGQRYNLILYDASVSAPYPVGTLDNFNYPAPQQTLSGVAASAGSTATAGTLAAGAVTMSGVAASADSTATAGTLAAGAVTMSGVPASAGEAATTGALLATATLAGAPAAAAVAATAGTLALGGGAQQMDGAPAAAGSTATAGTLAAGAVTMSGVAASAASTATVGALSVGAVTMSGSSAAAGEAATVGALSVGAATLSGTPASANATATTGTLSSGSGTLAGEAAVASVAATTGTLSVGAVTMSGAPASAGATATQGTLSSGGSIMSGVAASATPTATTGALSVGAVTLSGVAASAGSTATAGALLPGSVTASGAPATASIAAPTGALLATATLTGSAASAAVNATAGTLSVGTATLSGAAASAGSTATAGALQPGLVTMSGAVALASIAATTGALSQYELVQPKLTFRLAQQNTTTTHAPPNTSIRDAAPGRSVNTPRNETEA